jgi:lipid A 3-O-deacylase
MRGILRLAGLAAWSVLLTGGASAGDALAPGPARGGGFISELRLGGFVHDPLSPESGSVDVNGEILFAKPFTGSDALTDALIPRPHIGGTANFTGKTSHAYAGLSWTYDITSKLFVEGSLGGAVHNGKTGPLPVPGHNALGCRAGFREAASLGYRVSGQWSLMGTVEHVSNGGRCTQNRGLTNMGLRLGYSF